MKLVGPQLRQVSADELYIPLLQTWKGLEDVEVLRCEDSTNGTQPLDLLAMANLPALRTLHVVDCLCDENCLLRTRHLQELTQLGRLWLSHALPDEPVLPPSLTCLELGCLDGESDAAVAGPFTARMMENYSGTLGKLVLHGCMQLFNNNPGRFSGLFCLQQLRHLSLSFQCCSTDVCHFAFPQLQVLSITFAESSRPLRWSFSGCPVIQHAMLRIHSGSQEQTDLRKVVGLRAEQLELTFFIYPSTRRIALCATAWALGSRSSADLMLPQQIGRLACHTCRMCCVACWVWCLSAKSSLIRSLQAH